MGELTAVPLIRVTRGVVFAVVNWGGWVANCTTRFCMDARLVYPGRPFECSVCGLVADVAWPEEQREIEALLMLRPDPKTRNWSPPETPVDLAFENMAHGINGSANALDGSATGRLVLDIPDEGIPRIVLLDEPKAIDAAPRPEIAS
jgi:hypothetical protein